MNFNSHLPMVRQRSSPWRRLVAVLARAREALFSVVLSILGVRGAGEAVLDLKMCGVGESLRPRTIDRSRLSARWRKARCWLRERWSVILSLGIVLFPWGTVGNRLVLAGGAFSCVILVDRALRRAQAARRRVRIQTRLPTFIEEIVMAVEAGLDIAPALEAATQANAPSLGERERDEVRDIFLAVCKQCNSGVPLSLSLKAAAHETDIAMLRHACLYLAQAHADGGEVSRPLRELGDAVQIAYQECVEEEIAKLPVKATLPLVCAFAGLIICFITTPLSQVFEIIDSAATSSYGAGR